MWNLNFGFDTFLLHLKLTNKMFNAIYLAPKIAFLVVETEPHSKEGVSPNELCPYRTLSHDPTTVRAHLKTSRSTMLILHPNVIQTQLGTGSLRQCVNAMKNSSLILPVRMHLIPIEKSMIDPN